MKKLLILLLFSAFTSCTLIFPSVALKRTGVFETKSKLKKINFKEKKILFLGMHHIGRKEFYDDVAKKVDSLQKLGYVVFYERVADDKKTDSLIVLKNAMKLRKLMGFSPEKYLDTTTNIIAGRIKYRGKHKLMNQPSYTKLKVDKLTAIWGDVSMNELITEFEKEHTEIKLDSCDYKFSLRDKNYKCKKIDRDRLRDFKMGYIADYREKHLVNKIIDSKKNKVLVVYGSGHYLGVWSELYDLKKIDENKTKTDSIIN